METTTIQIEKPTKKTLNKLKENYSVKTYDEVIKRLINKKNKSMYGVLKGAGISTKQITKEIREERNNDRF